jgi:hypothetical protein
MGVGALGMSLWNKGDGGRKSLGTADLDRRLVGYDTVWSLRLLLLPRQLRLGLLVEILYSFRHEVECVVNVRPRPLYRPGAKTSGTHWIGVWFEPTHSWS